MIDGTGHKWTTEIGEEMTIPSKVTKDGNIDSSGSGFIIITLVSMS